MVLNLIFHLAFVRNSYKAKAKTYTWTPVRINFKLRTTNFMTLAKSLFFCSIYCVASKA